MIIISLLSVYSKIFENLFILAFMLIYQNPIWFLLNSSVFVVSKLYQPFNHQLHCCLKYFTNNNSIFLPANKYRFQIQSEAVLVTFTPFWTKFTTLFFTQRTIAVHDITCSIFSPIRCHFSWELCLRHESRCFEAQ